MLPVAGEPPSSDSFRAWLEGMWLTRAEFIKHEEHEEVAQGAHRVQRTAGPNGSAIALRSRWRAGSKGDAPLSWVRSSQVVRPPEVCACRKARDRQRSLSPRTRTCTM